MLAVYLDARVHVVPVFFFFLLFLYNMKMSNQIASSVKDVAVERDIRKFIRENHGATRAQAIRNACKHSVPSTVHL